MHASLFKYGGVYILEHWRFCKVKIMFLLQPLPRALVESVYGYVYSKILCLPALFQLLRYFSMAHSKAQQGKCNYIIIRVIGNKIQYQVSQILEVIHDSLID